MAMPLLSAGIVMLASSCAYCGGRLKKPTAAMAAIATMGAIRITSLVVNVLFLTAKSSMLQGLQALRCRDGASRTGGLITSEYNTLGNEDVPGQAGGGAGKLLQATVAA